MAPRRPIYTSGADRGLHNSVEEAAVQAGNPNPNEASLSVSTSFHYFLARNKTYTTAVRRIVAPTAASEVSGITLFDWTGSPGCFANRISRVSAKRAAEYSCAGLRRTQTSTSYTTPTMGLLHSG
eukprot:TRINITY_DN30373_c0_g1_i3.p1 TRINITY_DN30373_c0_g1~~TRINITY_DN30373_c0_g1_i3.p1  ORF type:complete len:125 (+),score=1.05 TRINITY_DN30373_c0_g1_i3:62-436(+)